MVYYPVKAEDVNEEAILAEVGKGWSYLIRIFLGLVKEHGLLICQVKGKFGGLRLYYMYDKPCTTEDAEIIEEIIHSLEIVSAYTCENCGAPGEAREHNQTLCDTCDKEKK